MNCLIYRSIKSYRDTTTLQQDLTALETWERDWQMAFHPKKCTTIHITRRRQPVRADYHLHGHTLESVPGGKYLGVHISQDLSWRDHINQTTAKANRSVGFLRRNLRSCPRVVKAQAYTALVRPVLEYASTVWDPYHQQQIQQLENVQRQAARFATGNYYSRDPGCVTSMLHQLEWEPLQHRRARNIFTCNHQDVELHPTSSEGINFPGQLPERHARHRLLRIHPKILDASAFNFLFLIL